VNIAQGGWCRARAVGGVGTPQIPLGPVGDELILGARRVVARRSRAGGVVTRSPGGAGGTCLA